MRSGEIYYADLSPTVGAEINKRRPVLIVSNDAYNRAASTINVAGRFGTSAADIPFSSSWNTNRNFIVAWVPMRMKFSAGPALCKTKSQISARNVEASAPPSALAGKDSSLRMRHSLRRPPRLMAALLGVEFEDHFMRCFPVGGVQPL